MSTLLQLVQQAAGEMGLSVPSVVAGATNTDTLQQLRLLNACGYELMRQHPWQALVKQNIITAIQTTVVGNSTINNNTISGIASTAGLDTTYMISGTGINQGTYVSAVGANSLTLSQLATASGTGTTFTLSKVKYAMPSDYDRPINRTHWDKTRHWEMLGPETAQQWEWLLSGYISTGPRIRYRILGSTFQVWPGVSNNEQLGFEYVANSWAADTNGVAKTSFTADTDTCIYPDRLMVLGLKKKYFQVKGFDASDFERDYQMELDMAKSNDGGALTLSMAPRVSNVLINWTNIPDSNYGS